MGQCPELGPIWSGVGRRNFCAVEAMDGITFRLALSALCQLEQSQHQQLWEILQKDPKP